MFVSVERSGVGAVNNDVGMCVPTEQECPIITASDGTSTLGMSTASCGSDGCSTSDSQTIPVLYIIIGGAAGGVVILLCLIITVIAFICVAKTRSMHKESLQDNPTYEPAGEYIVRVKGCLRKWEG